MDLDIVGVIAGFGSFAVATVLALTYAQQARTNKRQLEADKAQNDINERQVMLDSAHLVLDLNEYFMTEGVDEFMEGVISKGLGEELLTEKYNRTFFKCINHLNIICKLYMDKLITPMHMRNFFYSPLMALDDNDWIHEYLDKNRGGLIFLYRCLQEIRKEIPRKTDPFEQQKRLFDQTLKYD